MIAAAAAEGVTGRNFEDLVRDEVFRPLGLRSAGFSGSHEPNADHVAGRLSPQSPAGKMHMSLRDFSALLSDQLRGQTGKGKLLSAASYRRLHAPSVIRRKQPPDGDLMQVEPFNKSLSRLGSGHYWVAGANVNAKASSSLFAVTIPPGKNGLGPLRHALKKASLSLK